MEINLKNPFPSKSFDDWKNLLAGKDGREGLDQLKTMMEEGFTVDPLYSSYWPSMHANDQKNQCVPHPLVDSHSTGEWNVFAEVNIDWESLSAANTKSLMKRGLDRQRNEFNEDRKAGIRHFLLRNELKQEGLAKIQSQPLAKFSPEQLMASLFASEAGNKNGDGHGSEHSLVDSSLQISFRMEHSTEMMAKGFWSYCQSMKIPTQERKGEFYFDPLGLWGRMGCRNSLSDEMKKVWAYVQWAQDNFPQMSCLSICGDLYHEAGANEVQDLAFTMASALFYLRFLEKNHIPPTKAMNVLNSTLALGTDLFLGLAKLRAAHILWKRIMEICAGNTRCRPFLLVQDSRTHLTQRDPWVNLLRSSVVTAAASWGGADGILLSPFDSAFGPAGPLGRKMARNTQWILQQESFFGKVMDPAAGSFYVENLTAQMAEKAWALLQEIEKRGGMEKALSDGWVSEMIQKSKDQRLKDIKSRKISLTGVNEFPDLEEKLPEGVAESGSQWRKKTFLKPNLDLVRWSVPFEELRDKSDTYKEECGQRPQVILLSMGKISEHIQRTHFMQNFLQVGGFIPLMIEGGDNFSSSLIDQLKNLIPSTFGLAISAVDDFYQDKLPSFLSGLVEWGPTENESHFPVLITGKPLLLEGQNGSVVEFVFKGCRAHDILSSLWQYVEKRGKHYGP